MPVNWLKLMSFAFGAAVAALTGTLFAALNASVFPLTFSFPLLIIVYTMVILGGSGSQAGVVLGALVVSVLLELLRDPGNARVIFYAVIVLGAGRDFRASRRLGRGRRHAPLRLRRPRDRERYRRVVDRRRRAGGGGSDAIAHWVIVPTHLAGWVAPVSYVAPDRRRSSASRCHGWTRIAAPRADALPRGVRLGERDARPSRRRRATSSSA